MALKKITLSITIVSLFFIGAYAQKLPQVQQTSLRAPADIKIDGKPKEWGGRFQAYNKTTGVYYTIANDAENLYLAIYSNEKDYTDKIIRNGITISFNANKKSKDGSVVIKYPLSQAQTMDESNKYSEMIHKSRTEDPLLLKMNKAIVTKNKHLKVFGSKILTDTLYSIYDAKDILVGLDCPAENELYYEIAIPLKYLEFTSGALPKTNYNVQVNESWLAHLRPASFWAEEAHKVYGADFWGEYTLAK
ncbi:hypothetical protein GCM10027049_13310 [Mucilaginibacter puniceus]